MNITCPKCGFEQPTDRFCANCGIDMEHYRTPPKSLVQRFLSSSIFYAALAVMLVGLAVFFVGQVQSKKSASVRPSSPALDQKPLAPRETQRESLAAMAANEESTPTSAQESSTQNTISQPTPTPTPSTAKRSNSMRITWLEVNKNFFIELFGESLPIGQFRAGILMEEFNNRSLRMRIQTGQNEKLIRVLDSSSYPVSLVEGERQVEVKLRTHDPKVNEKIGVVLNLEPLHIDRAGLQLRFEIRRAIPVIQGRGYGLDTLNATDELLIPLRGAAFVSGFLPHREPFDDIEQTLFQSNSALNVLNSKSFQTGSSEIVVMVEALGSD